MKKYYHYTNEEGYHGILKDQHIRPSIKDISLPEDRTDASFGDGVYLTSIDPEEIGLPGSLVDDVLHELFLISPSYGKDKLDFFFELILPESDVTEFREMYFDLVGESLPVGMERRIALYKTQLPLFIGNFNHGKTFRSRGNFTNMVGLFMKIIRGSSSSYFFELKKKILRLT